MPDNTCASAREQFLTGALVLSRMDLIIEESFVMNGFALYKLFLVIFMIRSVLNSANWYVLETASTDIEFASTVFASLSGSKQPLYTGL